MKRWFCVELKEIITVNNLSNVIGHRVKIISNSDKPDYPIFMNLIGSEGVVNGIHLCQRTMSRQNQKLNVWHGFPPIEFGIDKYYMVCLDFGGFADVLDIDTELI